MSTYTINIAKNVKQSYGYQWIHESRVTLPDSTTNVQAIEIALKYKNAFRESFGDNQYQFTLIETPTVIQTHIDI